MRSHLSPVFFPVIDALITQLGHQYDYAFHELKKRPSDDGLVSFMNDVSQLMQGLESYKRYHTLVGRESLL